MSEKDEKKAVIKEALKEWLDEKYTQLGKWTLGAVMALAFAALIYFILWANGWHNENEGPDSKIHKHHFDGDALTEKLIKKRG